MSGFHQLRIRDEHAHKTAFVTEDGHYEWVVCPFGLSSTPSCFQRLMSTVLEEHIRAGYVVVYVDDICIFTKTDDPHEHLDKLVKVSDSLRQHDLLEKGSKCSLFRTEMEFLGFLVSTDGTRPTGRTDFVVGVGWYRCSSASIALCISWSRGLDMASRLRRHGCHGSRVGSTGG